MMGISSSNQERKGTVLLSDSCLATSQYRAPNWVEFNRFYAYVGHVQFTNRCGCGFVCLWPKRSFNLWDRACHGRVSKETMRVVKFHSMWSVDNVCSSRTDTTEKSCSRSKQGNNKTSSM